MQHHWYLECPAVQCSLKLADGHYVIAEMFANSICLCISEMSCNAGNAQNHTLAAADSITVTPQDDALSE